MPGSFTIYINKNSTAAQVKQAIFINVNGKRTGHIGYNSTAAQVKQAIEL